VVMLNPARRAAPRGSAGKGGAALIISGGTGGGAALIISGEPLAKIALITGVTWQGSPCLAEFATGCHTSHLRLPARGFGGA
jgi:hypothetical protein